MVALAAVLAAGHAGGVLARWARQPPVIGEIAAGLAAGPALLALAGDRVDVLLPHPVLHTLQLCGQIGLALFLVGVGYEIRPGESGVGGRTIGWVIAGALLPAMLTGGVLALWVAAGGHPALRGGAPAAAFGLLLVVALAVTAVPVLARILADRHMLASTEGRIALTAAVAIDALTWLLLAVALGLAAGGRGGAVQALGVLAMGGLGCLALRRALAGATPTRLCARYPRAAAVALGAAALACAAVTEHYRLTVVFGAVMLGLALPHGERGAAWDRAVRSTATVGRWLVPVFFTTTGLALSSSRAHTVAWTALAVVVVLAVLGKVAGGWLGARIGGLPPWTGLRLGILMNTRGLTEIVVLQAGYSAGILTPQLFLALVLMALLATALTGPLLSLTDRRAAVAAGDCHVPSCRQSLSNPSRRRSNANSNSN
jgi:Kef-type K+ transport system membrane component KefB